MKRIIDKIPSITILNGRIVVNKINKLNLVLSGILCENARSILIAILSLNVLLIAFNEYIGKYNDNCKLHVVQIAH